MYRNCTKFILNLTITKVYLFIFINMLASRICYRLKIWTVINIPRHVKQLTFFISSDHLQYRKLLFHYWHGTVNITVRHVLPVHTFCQWPHEKEYRFREVDILKPCFLQDTKTNLLWISHRLNERKLALVIILGLFDPVVLCFATYCVIYLILRAYSHVCGCTDQWEL